MNIRIKETRQSVSIVIKKTVVYPRTVHIICIFQVGVNNCDRCLSYAVPQNFSKELKENIVLMNKMGNILLTVVKHAASQGFWLKKEKKCGIICRNVNKFLLLFSGDSFIYM